MKNIKKLTAVVLILFVIIVFLIKFADTENKVLLHKNNEKEFSKEQVVFEPETIPEKQRLSEEEQEQIIQQLRELGY
ncbi:MAG: hypothetical protein KKA51_03515 [Nanoarchaeota archaeon]|nr:hypothetical protein [Nanoarchaeota archaeon]MBU2443669.1 hypothetical protein [Nanoarchaeota archaeon]